MGYCFGRFSLITKKGGTVDYLILHWKLAIGVAAVILAVLSYRRVLWLFGVIIVPDDSIGIVTKKFVIFGKN